jgi:hypothetical protein
MKTSAILVIIFIAVNVMGCNDNHPSGIYVCDKSNKKADTTIHYKNNDVGYLDLTCVCDQIEFKGNSTVVLTLTGKQQYPTSYVVDKEYIRIKTDGPDVLLKMKNNNTLISEAGFMQGTYNRK